MPLERIVHARRDANRDVELFLAPSLTESLLVVWRPIRFGADDPRQELWRRRDERLAALVGEDLYTRELVAGAALLQVQKLELARRAFQTATRSADRRQVGIALLGLGDIAAGQGDLVGAEGFYRRVTALRDSDPAPDASLTAIVDIALEQLELLPPR